MKKFKLKEYDGERFSPEAWCNNVHNTLGYDLGLQIRRYKDNENVVSSQKIYSFKKNKYNQCLSELNPDDKLKLYFNDKSQEEITRTEFYKQANDGDDILPYWIVLDIDFNHKSINFKDDKNSLFKILKKLDNENLKYILFGTEEGRSIKIIFPFQDLKNNPDENLKKGIGKYLISIIGEKYKPELKLSGAQCSFCFPAKEGGEPLHAKTDKSIKILHFTGLDNSLNEILEKIPDEECSNKIVFEYDSIKPKKDIRNLEELKEIIIKYFPDIWEDVEICLSSYCSIVLKNLNGCMVLILVGNPSGEKTTVLSFFYGYKLSYITDDFTPRAFVSHSANVKKLDLEDIDLLPKIKNTILITPELAPLFEAPKDKLIDNFSMLTRVLDGEGLNRDSGTHGHRGYSGDFKFIWLGATTPLRASVWNIMGKIGNRIFFKSVNEKNREDSDYLKMFSEEEYEEKIKICRGAIHSFLNIFFKKNAVRSLEWSNNEQDIFILKDIIKYSKLLTKLRGNLMTWKSEERGEYEYSFPIIEEPPRAINFLRNLARGHALINNRNYLNSEDLTIVRKVCLSSMPHDRFKLFELLRKHEGKITTKIIEQELNCSQDTALRTMKIFKVLGVVDIKSLPIGDGHPIHYVEIKPEFQELINNTHSINNEINPKSQENPPARDNNSELNAEDPVENDS